MHELPITEDILRVAIKHAEDAGASKVVLVNLRIGALRDIQEEWMQRYMDFASAGTIAEGCQVYITRSPVIVSCSECGKQQEFTLASDVPPACPDHPGAEFTAVTGNELIIEGIGVA